MKMAFALLLLFSLTASGQTAKEYYNLGTDKANAHNFKGALEDFDNAIRLDRNYAGAYYNRGTVKLHMEDYKGAIADLDKAASLDPGNRNIYSNRGIARLQSNDTKGAIIDFDKALRIDSTSESDYFMRGQAKIASRDVLGGCTDLHIARSLGSEKAQKFISEYCKDSIVDLRVSKNREYLRLDWPDEEGWRMANNEVSGITRTIELLRNKETFENWTEIGTMIVYSSPGVMPPVDDAMNFMGEQAKKQCPSAVVTFLEKDEKTEYPWIIFKIECGVEAPESQVWQIIEGKEDMYVNFRAVKQKKIPDDLKNKWVKFFKTARVKKS
jgi:tetratricopeptide (TPR) repeat protein